VPEPVRHEHPEEVGDMGFCKELPIERYYRIFDGTAEIRRTVIARSVSKRGHALFDVDA
jgi:acyl-CoA dehydrogenase